MCQGPQIVGRLALPITGTEVAVATCMQRTRTWQLALCLTPRQVDVMTRLVRGDCNKEIAAYLSISRRTVEIHVAALLDKSGCDSRARFIAQFWSTPLRDFDLPASA